MDINIGRLLARRALLDGDRLALVSEERRLSFRDLNGEACRAAHALAANGVRAGDRVAALMRNGPDYVALYYGAAKIGAILCAINWRLAAQEIDYILGDSEPKLLVHGTEFAPAVSAGGRRGLTVSAAETGWRAQIAAAPAQEPQAAMGGGEPLVLVYTSGTTGRPKGAVLTHNQMYWASATMAASHDYRPGDVNLVPTPLFHVGGLSFATLFVHMGATLVLPRAWEPSAVLALIAKERINHFFAVPAMVRSLLEHPNFVTAELSSLRWILCGGAPVPPELIAAAGQRGIPVQQTYGATETAGPATLVDLAHASAKAGSAGLPYFHTELRIVDAAGAELTRGEPRRVRRRMAQDRRSRPTRRGRLPLSRRPRERRDHHRRRERLSRRAGGRATRISGRRGDRRRRCARPRMGRGALRRHRAGTGPAGHARFAARVLRGPHRPLQAAAPARSAHGAAAAHSQRPGAEA